MKRGNQGRDNQPQAPSPMSIRAKLLLTVNAVFLVGLSGLLLLDYQRSLAERLRDKQVAMSEEAALILPAVSALHDQGLDAVQAYIDRACAQMQDALSPGHHIAVRLGDMVLQARTHHRASPAFAHAMQLAATSSDHSAKVDDRMILVGSRGDDTVRVYVSEFTSNVRRAARIQAISRGVGIGLVGLLGAGVVNLLLLRLVTRPIDRLVRTVRRIGGGDLGIVPQRFTTAELDYLANEIGNMSRSLAEADQHRAQQLAKARRIQQNLLPHPDALKSVGIHHVHMPAEDVGGDFFDVRVIDEHRLVMCIGDVTGHGVPAAMSASMLKTLFQHGTAEPANPAAALAEINHRFHAVTLDGDFATMFMAVVDWHEGRLTYASAGHEFGYLVRPGGHIDKLGATGLLLGIEPDADCELVHLDLHQGDAIVLLTDGLVETMSPTGKLLGRSAIMEVLVKIGERPADEIAASLIELAEVHRDGLPQQDDMTLAILKTGT